MLDDIPILIPAAGASSRMGGRDKLAEDVGGLTALAHAAHVALATGARVIVTLPADGPYALSRRATLAGLALTILPLADWREGLAASLREGVRAAAGAGGLMIHLPDMPDLTTDDLQAVRRAFGQTPDHPARGATADGQPGHPVILPACLFPALSRLAGDRGAAGLLADADARLVPLPGNRARRDLDTAEDWEDWRRGKSMSAPPRLT